MLKILITGGCGFIGANLCEYLLHKGGYELRVLDDLSAGRREYLDRVARHTGGEIELVEGDIRDRAMVDRAVQGVDAVAHLAAKTSVVDSLHDPEGVFQVNVMGTLNLLQACRKHGVERFVFASSNAAVGDQAPPIDEKKVPAPISPYGASKLAGEALCAAYFGSFGIKAVALRFANVYGPYSDHKPSVIPLFMRRIQAGEPLIIYGDGNQTRDFVYVEDVCQAVELALGYEPSHPGELVFQIGSGRETSLLQLIEYLKDIAAGGGHRLPPVEFKSARPGEILRNYSNISRAQTHLGYRPRFELAQGLEKLWQYFSHP
jgi:UDP-glucose 4-epimerase